MRISGFTWLAMFCALGCACGGVPDASKCLTNDDCVEGYLCLAESCTEMVPVKIATEQIPDGLVGAGYTTTLQATGGVEPYHWSLLEGPGWVAIDSDTGRLYGTPGQAGSGLVMRVKVTDSTSGRDSSDEASYSFSVVVCSDGQTVVCHEVQQGRCLVGRQRCTDGQWGECSDMEFSLDTLMCGGDCGECPTDISDRCRQGACACGDGDACTGLNICCGSRCVDGGVDGNCGACGRVCSENMPNSVAPRCQEGVCVSDGCAAGFIDCDGDAGNGCDTEVSVSACGDCRLDCAVAVQNVEQALCVADGQGWACDYSGQGATGEGCELGYLDCEGDRSNGCELAVDGANCGACGMNCAARCQVHPEGDRYWCNCESDADCGSDGLCCDSECYLSSDVRHCGSCGNDCLASVQHAPATCVGGQCGHGQCEHGWLDCDNDAGNGCETSFSNTDCGQCAMNCGDNAFCDDGSCACGAAFGNCLDGWTDGCETDLMVTVAHCGQCGHDCVQDLQNVIGPLCSGGHCDFTSCQAGYGSCDDDRSDGCEEDIWETEDCGTGRHSRSNCLAEVQHAYGIFCDGGVCNFDTCQSAFANCDGVRADGCEENIWEVADCGTNCTNRVNCNSTVQNASGMTCTSGACDFSDCNAGFGNCDSVRTNGCEENIWEVADCGTNCTNRVNCNNLVQNVETVLCTSGECNYTTCVDSIFDFCFNIVGFPEEPCYRDCDGVRTNGCENNLWATSNCRNSCTDTGVNCSTAVVNTNQTFCDGGSCNYVSCTTSYGDCDGSRSNGCETNLWLAGACGTTCNNRVNCNNTVLNATGKTCTGGACNYSACNSGYGDCDSNRTNGCEVNIWQVTSCGTNCSNRINCTTLPNTINEWCLNGTCLFQCNTNWYNCDNIQNNGCERNSPCP